MFWLQLLHSIFDGEAKVKAIANDGSSITTDTIFTVNAGENIVA